MNQERLSTYAYDSAISSSGLVIVTHRGQTQAGLHRLTIGSPGLPNLTRNVELGEALIFETATDGMYEVRLIGMGEHEQVFFLLTQITPSFGLSAGFSTDDPSNAPLTKEEIDRITTSIESVKSTIKEQCNITDEQHSILSQKLDEIMLASSRMGRKDWLMYTAGTLTSLCITAAFAPDLSKAIFSQVSSALAWLFQNSLRFIQ